MKPRTGPVSAETQARSLSKLKLRHFQVVVRSVPSTCITAREYHGYRLDDQVGDRGKVRKIPLHFLSLFATASCE